ncbi:efflux RND transporter periplasmic adaptor subunit [Polaribacter pectinis]|uniref:Efflux RND transporter periplasmic adaptor subunit n=1 Tax=Polaribacter pectinis TaxID=2738844 RepID=A0A7G9LBZ3_9FLAO|nr:efflux RND transporter periplasmic adaptor subunit [Polaribacter pectinis]QNM86142.1 efflux RND transporter periplasmic adaptor subunit [Polaribacter pectinis]
MKNKKQLFILIIPILIVVVGIFLLIIQKPSENENRVFVGLFETTEIRVASEIPGRIEKIYVKLGDKVKKGQLLATIESDILDAKIEQAEGMFDAAKSVNQKANFGARKQEVAAAEDSYKMAQSQYKYAEKSFKRLEVMSKDSLISAQKMDEITFKRDAAFDQMNAAKLIFEMAKEGARIEDKKASKGQMNAAGGMVNEAKAYYKELEIYAPVSGEISSKLAEKSEVMPAGYPIFTVQKLEDIYAVIHVREDFLQNFSMGTEVSGKLPAFNNNSHQFKVTYIAPMADFADWIPTADKGRLDMKTFEIHLTPIEKIENLRPGMSLNIKL